MGFACLKGESENGDSFVSDRVEQFSDDFVCEPPALPVVDFNYLWKICLKVKSMQILLIC